MATISGNVMFDRDRSATINAGDTGLANIPVVLQNVNTTERLTVLTDSAGSYRFNNVPNGNYRIVESYGSPDGVPTPADFSTAAAGSVPQGMNPPITAAANPPSGATHLDAITPNTLLITVSGTDISNQNFLNGPVIYTPIQTILDPCAIISGENLINAADDGTFGSFPQGTPANTGAPVEPYPGVTPDFTYVLPNPNVYTPAGGEYTVQNIMNNALSEQIGAWWRIADHTEGNETGRMMVVNGYNPGAVFFRDIVTVQPNTNYLFTSWILNLFKVNGYPDPQLGVRVTGQNGDILYSATLGTLIPVNPNAPEWKQIGSVINSQNNTSLTIEFLSEGPEVIGNDYAIDDISFNEIQVPQFIPVKTVDRQAADVGDTVYYTVTLTNSCASPLTNLFFQDIIPNGLSFVPDSVIINGTSAPASNPNTGFMLPDLPGGETITVTFAAIVDTVPTLNPALNSASIRYQYTPVEGGIPGEFTVVSNEVPVEVSTLADLAVLKTANPSPANPGAFLMYTITVTNAGPSNAENVVLADNIPVELTGAEYSIDGGATFFPWNSPYLLGSLAPGASRTIYIRGILSASTSNPITNTAIVSSTTPDPNPDNNTSTIITPVTPTADLSIIKSASPSPVIAGEVLTYTLLISNAGPSTAVSTNFFDQLPAELIGAEISTNGGTSWTPYISSLFLGNIEPNASLQILIRATVSTAASENLTNTAIVNSSTFDPNLDNNTSTVITPVTPDTPCADLCIQKTACPSPAIRCRQLTYTLLVTNLGPSAAEQVTITDMVSTDLCDPVFSMDSGHTWYPWTDSYVAGTLPAHTSISILIAGTVNACAKSPLCNKAQVSSITHDPNLLNNCSSSTVRICSL